MHSHLNLTIKNDNINDNNDGYMYVSSQDTQSLLLYNNVGNAITGLNGMNGNYPGAIVTYGNYSTNSDGIRGIAIDNINGYIYVCQENYNIIFVYDINNNFKNIFNITNGKLTFKPIGIEYNSNYFENILYVGDDDTNRIYSFKININYNYTLYWISDENDNLSHPAGLSLSQDVLYVISQDKDRIVRFNPNNGNYEKTIVNFNDKTGNHLTGESLLYLQHGYCF